MAPGYLPDFDLSLFDCAWSDNTWAVNVVSTFNWHHERFVDGSLRNWDQSVHGVEELLDSEFSQFWVCVLNGRNGGTLMKVVFDGSYSCFFKSYFNYSSMRSTISVSLIMSILFKKTMIWLTPICLQSKTCYLVWGMGPSVAATTKIPASILAAPVIMFLT